jgi:hypothetical protein
MPTTIQAADEEVPEGERQGAMVDGIEFPTGAEGLGGGSPPPQEEVAPKADLINGVLFFLVEGRNSLIVETKRGEFKTLGSVTDQVKVYKIVKSLMKQWLVEQGIIEPGVRL